MEGPHSVINYCPHHAKFSYVGRLQTISKCHTTRMLDIDNKIRHGGHMSASK